MAIKLKPLIQNSVSILIAVAFLYYAFSGARFDDLWNSLLTANYWLILALIPINIGSHWYRAVRWQYLLKPLKENTRKRNLFSGVIIGYAVNNILPRVGELVRPYLVGNLEGISKTAALGTVVLERILDFMTFYFLVCVVMFVYPHSLDAFVNNVDAVRPFFLAGSVFALALFVILFFKAEQAARFIITLARFLPDRFRATIDRVASTFATGLSISHIRDHIVAVLGLSFLIWGFYALAMYIPFYALAPIAEKGLTFGDAVLLLVVSSIAWILPAPGAMGTYHSFVTVALVKLYGIDATTALSFSLITHEVGYLVVMGIGGWFYWRDRKALTGMSLTNS